MIDDGEVDELCRLTDSSHSKASPLSSLAYAASGLSLLACAVAVVAFLREVALATAFGAGASVDAYLVALTGPFLLNASIVSTLEAAFIPIYLKCKTEDGLTRATRFAATTHLWLLAGGAALTVAMSAAAPLFLPMQAPGFSADRLAVAARLAWLITPSVLFSGLYALGRSVLNAERRFVWPALAPGIGAGVTTAVILLGHETFGISAAALGYTAGTAAQWLVVFVPLVASGLPGRGLTTHWRNEDAGHLVRVAAPLCVGVVATAAIAVVDRFTASRFPAGVISALAYADRIIQIPLTVLATAVTTAAFPTLSLFAARGDLAGLRRTLGAGMQLLAMSLVPIAVLLIVFRRDVVAVVFEHGRFGASDAETVAVVLAGLSIGLAFMGTFQLIPRVFNALQMAPFVALSGLLNLGFKIVFNVLLVPVLGYAGFAVATSAMYTTVGAIMLWLLGRRLNGLDLKALLPSLGLTAVGSSVLGILAFALAVVLVATGPLNRLILAGGISSAAYVGAMWWLGGRPSYVANPRAYSDRDI